MRTLTPGINRADCDLVATPYPLAKQIVLHFRPTGLVLDPCRGPTRPFFRALRRYGCDVDWCELSEGRNFLDYAERVNWIITNPPWSKLRQFLEHAMRLADEVVFLAALSAFTLRYRMKLIRDAGFGLREALLLDHPAKPWLASGFQLAAIHVQRAYGGAFQLTEP